MISLDDVVVRSDEYAYRIVHGKTYLTNGLETALLNRTGTVLWQLLEQPRRVDWLATQIGQRYGLSKDHVAGDIRALLSLMFKRGLVEVNGKKKKSLPKKLPAKQRYAFAKKMIDIINDTIEQRILIKLVLELTYNCNLHCDYCYATDTSQSELSTNDIFDILLQAKEMGCLYLSLTGGEPFVRRDLVDIVAFADRHGYHTLIQTNGTLIDEAKADALARFKHLIVAVTLHGASAATHERFTHVPGSFEKSVNGIRNLTSRGIQTVVRQVVMNNNVAETEQMGDLAHSLGATINRNPMLYPSVLGSTEHLSQRVSDRVLRELMKAEMCVPHPDPCGAGSNRLTIGPDGTVYPCQFVHIPVGDVRKQTLEEIWHSPPLQRIRDEGWFTTPDVCKQCSRVEWCPRCPALAYLEHGSFRVRSAEACRISRVFEEVRPLLKW